MIPGAYRQAQRQKILVDASCLDRSRLGANGITSISIARAIPDRSRVAKKQTATVQGQGEFDNAN